MFANKSPEAGAEAMFTAALRDELLRAGREGGEASDARVQGEVIQVAGGPAIVTNAVARDQVIAQNSLISYRIQAAATVRVFKGAQKVYELTVSGGEDYLPGSSILESEANRRAALRRLAATLMRQAFEGITSGL